MELKSLLGLLDKSEGFGRLMERLQSGVVVSAPGPLRPYLAAGIAARSGRPVLVVTSRPADAERFTRDAKAFFASTHLLPSPEVLPHEPVSPSAARVGKEFEALHALSSEGGTLVAAPVAAVLRKIPGQKWGLHLPIEVRKGADEDFTSLCLRLAQLGYRRTSLVEERGEFAVRGGIIDIFPSDSEHPVRIEFFGDEIESIRTFHAGTQLALEELSRASIYACREIVADAESLSKAADALSTIPWFAEEAGQLRGGMMFEGIERFAPLIYSEMATPIDYLRKDGTLVLDSPTDVEAEASRFLKSQRGNLERAIASGAALNLDYYADSEILKGRQSVALSSGPADIAFDCRPVRSIMGQLEKLADEVKSLTEKGLDVVIALNDAGQAERIGEVLVSEGVKLEDRAAEIAVSDRPKEGGQEKAGSSRALGQRRIAPLSPSGVHLAIGEISSGFVFGEVGFAVLSYSDIFFRRRDRRASRIGARLSDLIDLEVGDYVVHVVHGIARYGGLVKRTADGVERDYVLLEYAEGDKLYVPVDQLDRVGKYIGTGEGPPNVTRLGSLDWPKAKKKAKAAAWKMAFDLLALYAKRASTKGYAFSPDTPWQRELEEAFPFDETEDQALAIGEVKRDMESERPMDRLVCGDVGYGKTEVAIRAAFKAVMDGKQVVVLAPTTILAQQHYETFRERFAPFPVNVDVLSRFRSPKEQRKVAEAFAAGAIDVLVGTHRILSADIEAKDLGLIVVDEEQRFGVAAKEQLKNAKKSVDVLTLSATPIPRTLQMALSGLKDLSVIETPPEDRHPVATYVGPFDEGLIRDAIQRELSRGGQCFFVHNHIETISGAAERLRSLVPEAAIAIVHGRMSERKLEKVMLDFLDKRFDVLVSTTIVENGLDIPSVNTLIVDRADRLGLAQLYQLRGRVGRSDERAYAYFLYEPKSVMSANALERLKAIADHSELGSGTRIALRDLEIRGAGNLLGPEQHGHVSAVGFELYCDLLREAMEELSGEVPKEKPEIAVEISIDAYFPETYIPAENLRIEAYRKLARATDEASIDRFESELIDRYGRLPAEAKNLLDIARLKSRAAALGLTGIRWSGGTLTLSGTGFGAEWVEVSRALKPEAEALSWLGRFTIKGIGASEVISFLTELFSGIMAWLQ